MTTNINNLRDPPDQWDFILLSKRTEIRPWEKKRVGDLGCAEAYGSQTGRETVFFLLKNMFRQLD